MNDLPRDPEPLTRTFRRLAFAAENSDAWYELGQSLRAAGRDIDALAALSESLRLAANPLAIASDVAEAAITCNETAAELARRRGSNGSKASGADMLIAARLLHHQGKLEAAAALLEEALDQAPGSKEVAAEFAAVRFEIARDDKAEAALRRALGLDPNADDLRHKLARILIHMGRPNAARHELVACLSASYEQRVDLALVELQLSHQDAARACIEESLKDGGDGPDARRMLATILAYSHGVSGRDLSEAMRQAGETWRRADSPRSRASVDRDKRLRLGFLGGGLWRHPSSWLTIRGVEALDPAEFEIHCFSPGHRSDDFTERWKALSAGWHETRGLSDEAVANMVRRCGIDILVDLGGYLNFGRMTVMAHRPSCLQIKWVGAQFHTTAFPGIDAFVTDVYETPPELAHLYSESLIRLSGSYVCYDPPRSIPDVAALPADTNGFVTFGSFNNLMKVTPQTIDAWALVIRNVEGSRLRMRAPQFDEDETRSDIVAAFRTRGVASERLHLSGSADHAIVLAEHNAVDIALQPFPYCGGVTLLEALAMGVPSVAFCGETFAARHGLSHLGNVGLSDWVAMSTSGYVETAILKTADKPALRALRSDLRRRLLASPICDSARFAREFTAQVQRLWQERVRVASRIP